MNCPDFDILMMLLDGELGEERMKEVSDHVKSCSRCKELIDSQRMLETSWRDSFVTPDVDAFRSMEWMIYRKMNRRARWKFFVPAAAGIIAVLLGVKLIIDNEPFKGRLNELSREGRTDYDSYTLRLEYVQDESTVSGIDGVESEETAADESIIAPSEELVSAEDVSVETTSESVGYGNAEAEVALPQSATEEDGSEGYLRGTSSVAQETDWQAITGGEPIAGGSGGIGSSSPGGFVIEEECGEVEIPEEIVFAGIVEGSTTTLSPNADTEGLAVTETVPSSTGIYEYTEDNRDSELNQTCDLYSRFYEISENNLNARKADVYVKLVFDAGGQPDSSTALLFDSLFADWSDYIPFVYRDTVLIVPLSSVLELFMEGSTGPAETIE